MANAKLASLLVFLITLVAATSQQRACTLVLSPSTGVTSWPSPSGLFRFGFYHQGDNKYAVGIWLVIDPDNTVLVWTARRDDPLVSSNSTIFCNNGTLLLRIESTAEETPIADPEEVKGAAASASILDSGNLVLYNNESRIIWQSFDHPTDTILGGQQLSEKQQLVSSKSLSDRSSGRFFLLMQEDGNLVAYPVNSPNAPGDAYWASGTSFGSSVALNLTQGGSLILNDGSAPVYTLFNNSYSGSNDTVLYRATLDIAGNFKLYQHRFMVSSNSNMSLLWQAVPAVCNIHGFCGFNSFCTPNVTDSSIGDCRCFPGFDLIDQTNKFLGCHVSADNVKDHCGPERSNFSIVQVRNISSFEGQAYSVFPFPTIQQCEESCRDDCNCEVASYSNKNCNKMKLPINYAASNRRDASVVLVKKKLVPVTGRAGPQIAPPTTEVIDNKRILITVLAASLGSVTVMCSLIALFSFFLYRRRVHEYEKMSKSMNSGPMKEFALRSFSYDEIWKATDRFKEELGKEMYKGNLDQKIVAVKRVTDQDGDKEFCAEMNMTSRTHHKNLVRLLGFCIDSSTRKFLVYEHTSNGSLADHLFGVQTGPAWREKVRIGLEIARGILYLHDECEVQIVHCDIRPQNIVIDEAWTAKISNFGLAKVLAPSQTGRVVNSARTAMGYTAPEVQKNGFLSTKADIYSFGVVLLEIVFQRSITEVDGESKKLIVGGDVGSKSLARMAEVGALCTQDNPDLRPSINDTILMLEGIMDIPEPLLLPVSSSSDNSYFLL